MSSEVSGGFALISRLIHHQNTHLLALIHFDKVVVKSEHQENNLSNKRHVTHAGPTLPNCALINSKCAGTWEQPQSNILWENCIYQLH